MHHRKCIINCTLYTDMMHFMMMNYEQIENDQNLERERESDRTEARRTFPFFIAVWCVRMKEERQARAQYAR